METVEKWQAECACVATAAELALRASVEAKAAVKATAYEVIVESDC